VVTDVQIVRQVGRPPLALQPQGFSCRVQAYFEQKDTKATKFKNRAQKGVLIFSFSVFASRFSAFGNRILRFLCFLLFQDETNTMHPLFTKADKLSGEIIGAAIEVHRIMGSGSFRLPSEQISLAMQTLSCARAASTCAGMG